MDDLHPQDWLLIRQALVEWAGPPDAIETPREQRAWELIDAIGADLSVPAVEGDAQIDGDWRG